MKLENPYCSGKVTSGTLNVRDQSLAKDFEGSLVLLAGYDCVYSYSMLDSRVTERFTRISENEIHYAFSVDDDEIY